MADNYLQFSEIVKLKNEEEKKWVEWHLGIIPVSDDLVTDDDKAEYEKQLERYNLEPDDLSLDFQWEIDSSLQLWIYADEFGNVDNVALFMQEFLSKFDPDSSFSITYSSTCSKPRVGEFGGGAAFVTAENIDWVNSHDWIREKHKEKRGMNKKIKTKTKGFTIIELMIVIAIIAIIVAIVIGSVGGMSGKDKSSAEENAKQFIKNMDLEVDKVQCNGVDSDNDGYVSCMFKMNDGKMQQFECAGWTWNGSCTGFPK